MPKTGTVKTLKEKGFGFIKPDGGGKDVFFHTSVLQRGSFGKLQAGQKVQYEDKMGDRGPQATSVTVL